MNIFIFLIVIIINYFIIRRIAKEKDFDYKEKSTNENKNDLIKILLYSILFMYMFKNNFNDNTSINIFIISMMFMSNIYGYIEKKSGLNVSLKSSEGREKILKNVVAPIFIVGFIFFYSYYKYFIKNKNTTNIYPFIMILILMKAFFLFPFMINKGSNDLNYHPHHWVIYYFLSCLVMSLFNKIKISNKNERNIKYFGVFLSGLAFGGFLHGASYYDVNINQLEYK